MPAGREKELPAVRLVLRVGQLGGAVVVVEEVLAEELTVCGRRWRPETRMDGACQIPVLVSWGAVADRLIEDVGARPRSRTGVQGRVGAGR